MEQTPVPPNPPPDPGEVFSDLTDHLHRARAVLAQTYRSLPEPGDVREVLYARLDHTGWLLAAVGELLDQAADAADRYEALRVKGGKP